MSSPTSSAAPASPPSTSSGEPGRPVRMSAAATSTRLGAPGGGHQGTQARAGGAAEVESGDRLVQPQRGVNHPGVGLLQVGGLGGGEPQRFRLRLGCFGRLRTERPSRGDRQRGGVLIEGRHSDRVPLAPAEPRNDPMAER
jgi:hypothetical protein